MVNNDRVSLSVAIDSLRQKITKAATAAESPAIPIKTARGRMKMTNPYDQALNTLSRMAQASQQLDDAGEQLAKKLHQRMEIEHSANPNSLLDIRGTQDYATFQTMLALKAKHREWARKIFGVMSGYEREMTTGTKNLAKGRVIGFTDADVTVGSTEPFAKAVQHKHTVATESAQVNDMIAKAANQLTGESGETPLTTQRKIIDVMINDPNNWWPFNPTDFKDLDPEANLNDGIIPFPLFQALGANAILKQLNKYKKGEKGLDQATKNHLMNVPSNQPPTLQKNPMYPRSTALYDSTGRRAELLTIKIVYGQPRHFSFNNNTVMVRVGIFCAYNENGSLKVKFQEYK